MIVVDKKCSLYRSHYYIEFSRNDCPPPPPPPGVAGPRPAGTDLTSRAATRVPELQPAGDLEPVKPTPGFLKVKFKLYRLLPSFSERLAAHRDSRNIFISIVSTTYFKPGRILSCLTFISKYGLNGKAGEVLGQ